MWQQQILHLSVALVCCKLRYAVIVCDYVWAHPAAHHTMISTTSSNNPQDMDTCLTYYLIMLNGLCRSLALVLSFTQLF